MWVIYSILCLKAIRLWGNSERDKMQTPPNVRKWTEILADIVMLIIGLVTSPKFIELMDELFTAFDLPDLFPNVDGATWDDNAPTEPLKNASAEDIAQSIARQMKAQQAGATEAEAAAAEQNRAARAAYLKTHPNGQ